jgi:hypothetical protein
VRIWLSKEDILIRETSRKHIQETRDSVIVIGQKLINLDESFKNHVTNENKVYCDIIKKIESSSCPQSETIKVLENHNKEQNGHLRELAEQSCETTKKLDAIINQTKGADRIRDGRRNMWTLIIAIVVCMIMGIGTFLTSFESLKQKTKNVPVLETKVENLEKFLVEKD